MANIFLDLESNSLALAGNVFSTAISSTAGLPSVNLSDCGANMASVLIATNTITGVGNVTLKVQQSPDDSTWTDIVDNLGNNVSTVVDTALEIALLSFNTLYPYVRLHGTLNSGTSVNVTSVFLAQRKIVPDNNGGFEVSSY